MKKSIKTILSVILCVAMLTATAYAPEPAAAEDGIVTITVNYVYLSNNGMVAQPYYASVPAGSEFKKEIAAPKLINYSVPVDKALGLNGSTITYSEDLSGNGSVKFDLDSVDADIAVTLYYKAGEAEYTVNHYIQNLDDDEYTFYDSRKLTGDIDAYTAAVVDSTIGTGFVCTGIPTYTIAADGTTVVDIYYDRVYYTVIFDVNGGVNGPAPIYAKYETTYDVDKIAQPSRAGYIFDGWSPEISGVVTEDVTYFAQWKPITDIADYTIVIWGQNANNDEYSYLTSGEAWGNVGNTVTWTPGMLICKEEATEHTHVLACYGVTSKVTPSNTELEYFNTLGLESGYVYHSNCTPIIGSGYDHYYLYFNGTWYTASSANINGNAVKDGSQSNLFYSDTFEKYNAKVNCGYEHGHDSSCYMNSLNPGADLWIYEKSDTVTVDANGKTVLNVYFTRQEFTLTFKYNYARNRGYQSTETIKARWGQNIKAEYEAISENADSTFWTLDQGGDGPYTNFFGIMPKASATYYNRGKTGDEGTMTYYAEDLNGNYQEMFSVSGVGGYSVTEEDRYEFEGFTFDHGTDIGSSCVGANFYYRRNSYELNFYSASNSTPDKSNSVQYESPLSAYEYIPTNKPDTVEADAVFVGWYLNPECTGDRFIFDSHTMPASNVALYAKWVNGLYTVETYLDSSFSELYTYEGYFGIQKDIEKYTLATAPVAPSKEGAAFVGWFYKDENGNEQPFSFTMPITKDYKLYPKYSNKVMITYTVHYYLEGTTTKLADDKTNAALIGTNITEKAKIGTELNLVSGVEQNNYFPENTSTSIVLDTDNNEIIFYYKKGVKVDYTVKYVDAQGNNLLDPVTKTTNYSIITETYVQIPGYSPRQYQITKELSFGESNEIVFVYDPLCTELTIKKTGAYDIDVNQTFIFTLIGTDTNNSDIVLTVTIHGNSEITITDLPLGSYKVIEQTGWSWRYTPDETVKSITVVQDATKNVVTFVNERTESKWLDGDNFIINLFGLKTLGGEL